MLGALKNAIGKKTTEEGFDLSSTPWKLSLITESNNIEVYIYFVTHKEAKDQEDSSVSKGWLSRGVTWWLD